MDIKCSFFAIVGGHCGHDTRVKNKSSECVQLLSCNHDITGHKSSLGLIDIESEVDLILARASMFTAPENIEQFAICPAHRSTLGAGWKQAENEKCRIPVILITYFFTTISIVTRGPFTIYDRGWAGKIQLTTKQNVLPHPLHHKKIQ
jgi:hypothetical protein